MITDAEFVAIRAFDRTLTRNANDAQRIINQKNTELVALQAVIRDLKAALASKTCAVAGLTSQTRAMIAAHPDSPLLRETGKVYDNGRKQKVLNTYFDSGYDSKALEMGIKDTSDMRIVTVASPPATAPRR